MIGKVTLNSKSLFAAMLFMVLAIYALTYFNGFRQNSTPATHTPPPAKIPTKPFAAFLTPLKTRNELGHLLELEGFTVGAEVGVQRGVFAEHTLHNWPSNQKYYLIDLWKVQENYVDGANVDNDEQERRFQETKSRVALWPTKTVFLRMLSTEAAKHIPDNSLDYVYIDARHDYCGAMEDMITYWPKLKSGGIFAGHDYMIAADSDTEDWSLCADGKTVNPGAVKGAVDEFAIAHGLQVSATYQEPHKWVSWISRKP